jgi:hypothetical protein
MISPNTEAPRLTRNLAGAIELSIETSSEVAEKMITDLGGVDVAERFSTPTHQKFLGALTVMEYCYDHDSNRFYTQSLMEAIMDGLDLQPFSKKIKKHGLAEITERLGAVRRLPTLLSTNIREDNVSHSIDVALQAQRIGARFAPEAQKPDHDSWSLEMGIVHDLDEIYGGDKVTIGIELTGDDLKNKAIEDHLKVALFEREFPGTTTGTLMGQYHSLTSVAAKSVKIVDKLPPTLSHTFDGGAVLLAEPYFLDTPHKYLASLSASTQCLAVPELRPMKFWLKLLVEGRAFAISKVYDEPIDSARNMAYSHARTNGLNYV